MIMKKERRRSTRIGIKVRIELAFGGEALINGVCLNIGEGGIFCETRKYVEPYTRVNIMITLPDGDKSNEFSCEGIVIRAEKKGMKNRAAIEFTRVEDMGRKSIRRYIDDTVEQ